MSRESFKGVLQGWEIRLTLHSYHHHLRPPLKQKIQLDTRSYLDGTKCKKVSQRRAICLTFRVMVLILIFLILQGLKNMEDWRLESHKGMLLFEIFYVEHLHVFYCER